MRVLASAYLGAWATDLGWWLGSGAEEGHAPHMLAILGAAFVTLSVSLSYAEQTGH